MKKIIKKKEKEKTSVGRRKKLESRIFSFAMTISGGVHAQRHQVLDLSS
jgi:hypothetical protein